MLKSLIPVAVTANLVLTPLVSQANTDMVRVIKPAQNGQINQMQPIPIGIANGTGITISFRQSGQSVSQAWLDNPAFVTLDANGCLSRSNDNCHHGTNVLHLKRIKDLTIPGLPKSPTTLLTVVTEGQDGGGIYVFKIYKSKTPTAIVFEVNRPTPPVPPTLNTIEPLIRPEEKNVKNP